MSVKINDTKTKAMLKELNLNFEVVLEDSVFKIEPRFHEDQIVLILLEKEYQSYELWWWVDDEPKEILEFEGVINILDNYRKIYKSITKEIGHERFKRIIKSN